MKYLKLLCSNSKHAWTEKFKRETNTYMSKNFVLIISRRVDEEIAIGFREKM